MYTVFVLDINRKSHVIYWTYNRCQVVMYRSSVTAYKYSYCVCIVVVDISLCICTALHYLLCLIAGFYYVDFIILQICDISHAKNVLWIFQLCVKYHQLLVK